ncbi:MAG: LptF/LptG family permease [Kiritimatiellales bacterium]|nr:LptF/LptG family permease [Kiritimatiellota bacterium]MBL7012666.1 LptF/LptG family permease [Kiritimatiellales bacterium]
MRILNRYILFDYLILFLTALGLITFVMTVGAMIKAVDLMSRGISPMLIAQFFFQNIPYILSFSMPISVLFAALLLFGRLSMDNEISAMKACGLSLWRLVAPLIVLSVFLTGICMYINCEVAPNAKYANKKLLHSAGVEEPINLLEEGRFIKDFPGLMIYVGRKNGNVVKDVVAYELADDGQIKRSVRAQQGDIETDNANRLVTVKLYDVRMEMPDAEDPHDVSKTTYVNAEYYPIKLDFDELLKSGSNLRRKPSYMNMALLLDHIRNVERDFPMLTAENQAIQRSRLVFEANRRVSVAIACFSFLLIGIPLGVKSHRKETSTGMVMSLAIVFAYYIFIVIAEALADYPGLHPNLILWLPLVGTQVLGLILIRRAS